MNVKAYFEQSSGMVARPCHCSVSSHGQLQKGAREVELAAGCCSAEQLAELFVQSATDGTEPWRFQAA